MQNGNENNFNRETKGNTMNIFADAPVIHAYTRRQAIEDGVLVEIPADMAKEAGIRFPVAMTIESFEATVGTGELPEGQDVKGRIWDVLNMFRIVAKRSVGDRVCFQVNVFDGTRYRMRCLTARIGPGDDPAPVITMMMAHED